MSFCQDICPRIVYLKFEPNKMFWDRLFQNKIKVKEKNLKAFSQLIEMSKFKFSVLSFIYSLIIEHTKY